MTAAAKRTRDAAQTRADILDAAFVQFADKGLAGARVEEIAAAIGITKATLYHYFPGKDDLYLAVLERAYRRMRDAEQALRIADLPPAEALVAIVGFTFDFDQANPGFIRLVANENLLHGAFIGRMPDPQSLNRPIIDTIRRVLDAGKAEGVFRPDADALEVHFLISALCFFSVSNRHTFHTLFREEPALKAGPARRRTLIVETVMRAVAHSEYTPNQHNKGGQE